MANNWVWKARESEKEWVRVIEGENMNIFIHEIPKGYIYNYIRWGTMIKQKKTKKLTDLARWHKTAIGYI